MKRPRTLSAAFCRSIKEPGRYGDGRGGHGLSLLVKESSTGRPSKSWAQRLRIDGEPGNIGLGSYPVVTLAEAREKALTNRRSIEHGQDPRTKVSTAPTFSQAVETVIDLHQANWKNPRVAGQWRASMKEYALPKLGRKTVAAITTSDIMAVLVPIWSDKRQTAMKIRRRISAVMRWAIAEGYRDDNPAGDAIGAALPKPTQQVVHQKALPFAEVGAALAAIRETGAWPATKLAFECLTLTACRSSEVRLAHWSEIDSVSRTWTIPAARMKGGRDHRIPLSSQAMDLLEQARESTGGEGLVFPSQRGKPLTDSTISKLVRENGIGCVPHGMRSSFRDWGAECSDAPREIAEFALGHVEGSAAELAYRRTDYFERRRELMQAWADYLAS